MTSRSATLARLRQVALAATAHYPLPPGRLVFVSHGENTTYRLEGRDRAGRPDRYLVRVHRPQRHGRDVDPAAAVASELAWLRAIRADTDLDVPDPVDATDGSPTVSATVAGVTRTCSVLRWMSGRIYEGSARPVHLRRLGAAAAVLHAQADSWSPPPGFVRMRWDYETFFGDAMVYGETPAARCWDLLPHDVRAGFAAVAERAAVVMPRVGDIGLVHADLHLGNALFERGRVKLIDFDDCGTGHRLYELAVSLWELRDEPDYPAYREALFGGYREHREIDDTHLDDVIAVRQVAFGLWYVGMAQVNPAFAARLDRVNGWHLAMLELLGAR